MRSAEAARELGNSNLNTRLMTDLRVTYFWSSKKYQYQANAGQPVPASK